MKKLIYIFSIFIILSCSSDPEIDPNLLDSVEILDSSLLFPENYLVSAKYPNPTEEEKNKNVIIAVHGFSASTFEWDELRKFIENRNIDTVLLSQVLLGGHGRSYEDFKASSYEDWQESIKAEYDKLIALGFTDITLVGSSTGCPLILDLLNIKYFGKELKEVFLIDPIIVPSDKMLSIVGVAGPILGYVESDLSAGEEKYWYKYRPYQTLEELNKLIIKVRKQLEDNLTIGDVKMTVYKSLKDDAADPVSAVLLYKGIKTNYGKINVEMIDSDLHVFTRLDLRPSVSPKDFYNQSKVFGAITKLPILK
jgi:carboxylesterase